MFKSRLLRKVIGIILLFFSIYAIVVTFYLSFFIREKFINNYLQKADSIISSISYSLPEILSSGDLSRIQALVNQFLQVQGIGYVLVMDKQGEVIAHTFVPAPPLTVITQSKIEKNKVEPIYIQIDGKKYIQIKKSVLLGEAGYIVIGIKYAEIQKEIMNFIFKINIFNLLGLVIIILITIFFMRKIIYPLKELTDFAYKVKKGEFNAIFSKKSDDEIGYLAIVFEDMAQELGRFFDKLKISISNATEELEDVINYLTVIMDTMADGLVVTDYSLNISQYNNSFKEIFKIKEKNLIAKNLKDILGFDLIQNLDLESLKEQSMIEFGYNVEKEDKYIECILTSVELKCENSLVFIFRDITERKRAEEDLQLLNQNLEHLILERTKRLQEINLRLNQEIEAKSRIEKDLKAEKDLFQLTLAGIGDAVITTDIKGNILFMNKTGEEMIGIELEKVKNSFFTDYIYLYEQEENLLCPVKQVLTKEKNWESDKLYLVNHKDKKIPVEVKVFPVRGFSAEMVGTVVVIKDISEKIQLEQERLRKEKLEALGVVAGGIAHDFNNLLTIILNHLNFLRLTRPEEKEKLVEQIEKVEKIILRAKQLTSQFLTFAKGGEPVKEAVKVDKIIKETAHFLLKGSAVKVSFDFPKEVPPVNVDASQFAQVIENLVINSLQAMEGKGRIQIGMRVEVLEEDNFWELKAGKYVLIYFQDTGPGVPKEVEAKIFEPYFTTKAKGSGLGLASCYSILKRHGGRIVYNATYSQGAEFILILPVSKTNNVLAKKEKQDAHTLEVFSVNKRVLIMDDEEEILEISRDVFSLFGFDCTCVRSGEEALEKYKQSLQNNKYDLVVLDLTVPGKMGGKETIKELLKIDPEVVAVVSSGYSQDPVMARYKEYGFKGVLSKPYSLEELKKMIQELLFL